MQANGESRCPEKSWDTAISRSTFRILRWSSPVTRSNRSLQRDRKFENGERPWLKNAQGVYDRAVTVVSARYDSVNNTWMYTLKDRNMQTISGEFVETRLG